MTKIVGPAYRVPCATNVAKFVYEKTPEIPDYIKLLESPNTLLADEDEEALIKELIFHLKEVESIRNDLRKIMNIRYRNSYQRAVTK